MKNKKTKFLNGKDFEKSLDKAIKKQSIFGRMDFQIFVENGCYKSLSFILAGSFKNETGILSSDCFKIESVEDDDWNTIIKIHPSTYIFALEFLEECFQENFIKVGNSRIMTITK